MDKPQFRRMINRVGETLEYVPEAQESHLMGLLRASLVAHPARDAKTQLALELNKLFLYLGEYKTAYLMMICNQVHVELDENMTKKDANRLWEHLGKTYDEFYDDDILC